MAWTSRSKKLLTTYEEFYSMAIKKLNYRDYSEKEMFVLLRRSACSASIAEEVIDKLKQNKYISDHRVIENIYNTWLQIELTGKNALAMKFKKYGIAETDTYDLLNDVSVEVEQEKCLLALEKILRTKKISMEEDLLKIKSFLYRKGFALNIINSTVILLKQKRSGE